MPFFLFVLVTLCFAKPTVTAYVSSWDANISALPYSKIDVAIYSFGIPNSFGYIEVKEGGKLETMVELAHSHKKKAFLAVGGWNLGDGGGDDSRFEKLASFAKLRKNFVESALSYIEDYDLDGIDLDWEYPDPKDSTNWNSLIEELSKALHAEGKELSIAVAAIGEHTLGVTRKSLSFFDRIHLMAYDDVNPKGHSTMAFAQESIKQWQAKGVPKHKMWLGVPFYGRAPYTQFKDIAGKTPTAHLEDCLQGLCYNGIKTIQQKAKLSKTDSLGGIMIWELSQDAPEQHSLLEAIRKEI